jgi:transcriptional regulator with XRE-family HTH domain
MKVHDRHAIRRWRIQRGLSQRELAFLCSRTQNSISLIETGGMTTLTEGFALSIAIRLAVPWESLFRSSWRSALADSETRVHSDVGEGAT